MASFQNLPESVVINNFYRGFRRSWAGAAFALIMKISADPLFCSSSSLFSVHSSTKPLLCWAGAQAQTPWRIFSCSTLGLYLRTLMAPNHHLAPSSYNVAHCCPPTSFASRSFLPSFSLVIAPLFPLWWLLTTPPPPPPPRSLRDAPYLCSMMAQSSLFMSILILVSSHCCHPLFRCPLPPPTHHKQHNGCVRHQGFGAFSAKITEIRIVWLIPLYSHTTERL